MIGQAFIEDTVIHANGRQIRDWLEGNYLSEYSDTSAQFCMLLCFCGHVNFHYGICQIVDGTLIPDTETWFALPGLLIIGYFTDPQEMKLQQHLAVKQVHVGTPTW